MMLKTDAIIDSHTVEITMVADFFRQYLEAIRCVSQPIYQQVTPVVTSYAFILTLRRKGAWEFSQLYNFLYKLMTEV